MNPNIPEEYKTMAALLGESAAIDSLMINNPAQLATNTNTLKRGIAEYQEQQKRERIQPPQQSVPTHHYGDVAATNIPLPYYPPQPIPQVPQYAPMPQKVDDGQLELNLEPSKADIIINLLNEISLKLTKQNSLIEKQYAIKPEKERVPVLATKPRHNP
jgi:hypothetical protein